MLGPGPREDAMDPSSACGRSGRRSNRQLLSMNGANSSREGPTGCTVVDRLGVSLNVNPLGSVTVVDPKTSAELQGKAPALCARLKGGTAHFQHVEASGVDALVELRNAFSGVMGEEIL